MKQSKELDRLEAYLTKKLNKSYCEHCNNTGWIDCHCGGDLCICENNGEEPCFYCEGIDDEEEE